MVIKHETFTPYPYQTAAVQAFQVTGHGVVVLPCGAGKTVIGVLAMAALGTRTLVLTSSREAVRRNGGVRAGAACATAAAVVARPALERRRSQRRA